MTYIVLAYSISGITLAAFCCSQLYAFKQLSAAEKVLREDTTTEKY